MRYLSAAAALCVALGAAAIWFVVAGLSRPPEQGGAGGSQTVGAGDGRAAGSQVTTQAADAPEWDAEVGDLPLPPDVEAMGRFFADAPGEKTIEDAAVVWQKRTDSYIRFLREKETFAEGAYRTYMVSELVTVLGNAGNFDPDDPEIVRLMARTRRLSKLVHHVNQARVGGASAVL